MLGMREMRGSWNNGNRMPVICGGGSQDAGTGCPYHWRWVDVFGEGGPVAMAFEQSGGSPSRSAECSRPN